jgi:hypothetical protein
MRGIWSSGSEYQDYRADELADRAKEMRQQNEAAFLELLQSIKRMRIYENTPRILTGKDYEEAS